MTLEERFSLRAAGIAIAGFHGKRMRLWGGQAGYDVLYSQGYVIVSFGVVDWTPESMPAGVAIAFDLKIFPEQNIVNIRPPQIFVMIVLVPPLDYVTPNNIHIEFDDKKFVCLDLDRDGNVCNREFATYCSLMAHRCNSGLGGEHGIITVGALAVDNRCIFCRVPFSSRGTAKTHIRRAVTLGRCKPVTNMFEYPVQLPLLPITCKLCWDTKLPRWAGPADSSGVLAPIHPGGGDGGGSGIDSGYAAASRERRKDSSHHRLLRDPIHVGRFITDSQSRTAPYRLALLRLQEHVPES